MNKAPRSPAGFCRRPFLADILHFSMQSAIIYWRAWKKSVSTAQAYAGITPRAARHNCRDVMALPVAEWRDVLVNDFEEGIFQKLPILREVKEQMYANGAEYAAMSGSGSTIFGIFAKEPDMTQFAGYYNKVIAI